MTDKILDWLLTLERHIVWRYAIGFCIAVWVLVIIAFCVA